MELQELKKKIMSELLSKDRTIKEVDFHIEQLEYDLKTARSPRKKKSVKSVLLFFKSLKHHLKL